MITHAVALHMFYEERAQGLLCGTDQVRTDDVTDFHDADRISDHETNLENPPFSSVRGAEDAPLTLENVAQNRESG